MDTAESEPMQIEEQPVVKTPTPKRKIVKKKVSAPAPAPAPEQEEIVPEEDAPAIDNKAATERKIEAPAFIVPIAQPLASDKLSAQLMKLVKAATQEKQIRRGVKELTKDLRRQKDPEKIRNRICVVAGDITPLDVISHIPVLCEENNVPYVFVRSREELGAACITKRPTSCVLVVLPDKSPNFKLFTQCRDQVQQMQPTY